jgi:4-hydroxybenzoate polyprenyltransferase
LGIALTYEKRAYKLNSKAQNSLCHVKIGFRILTTIITITTIIKKEWKMLKYFLIILIFVLLFVLEVPQLIKRKEMKELVVFSLLMLIGLALSILTIIRSFI